MRFRINRAQTEHGVFGERNNSADARCATIAVDEPIGSRGDAIRRLIRLGLKVVDGASPYNSWP